MVESGLGGQGMGQQQITIGIYFATHNQYLLQLLTASS